MKIKKIIVLIIVILIVILNLLCNINYTYASADNMLPKEREKITYESHVENIGWQNKVNEEKQAGTTGYGLRMEAIKINNPNKDFTIKYQAHVQNIGWQDWKKQGEIAGTTGYSLRMEAIKIKLENDNGLYDIKYRVHVQNIGWQDWKQNGEIAGTTGYGLRMEAIEIKITSRDGIDVIYTSHIQNYGWESSWYNNGSTSGTTGYGLRLEAFQMKLINPPEDAQILYTAYVKGRGWNDWIQDGDIAGSVGEALMVEAIKIKLDNLDDYNVKYRAHIQNIGWTSWKQNGEVLGTEKSNLRIEAIEVKLEKKGIIYYNGIDVSNHQGKIDWKKVKEENDIDFAIIRAGFRGYGQAGSMNKDERFDYNIKNALANNIDVGIYFFSQATTIEEATEEANYTLNIIKNYKDKITYPVIIDVEYANMEHTGRADGLSKEMRTQIVKTFCDVVKKEGYIPMFYTDKWFASNNLNMSELTDYEYWLAHYTGATKEDPLAEMSNYQGKYTIWQYTSAGSINGIESNVDLDISFYKYSE